MRNIVICLVALSSVANTTVKYSYYGKIIVLGYIKDAEENQEIPSAPTNMTCVCVRACVCMHAMPVEGDAGCAPLIKPVLGGR